MTRSFLLPLLHRHHIIARHFDVPLTVFVLCPPLNVDRHSSPESLRRPCRITIVSALPVLQCDHSSISKAHSHLWSVGYCTCKSPSLGKRQPIQHYSFFCPFTSDYGGTSSPFQSQQRPRKPSIPPPSSPLPPLLSTRHSCSALYSGLNSFSSFTFAQNSFERFVFTVPG